MRWIENSLTVSVIAILFLSTAFVAAQDKKDATPSASKPEDKKGDEKGNVEKKKEEVRKKNIDAAIKAKADREAEQEKQLAAQMDQLIPQLKPYLVSEIELVSMVCKTTAEQRGKVEKEGDSTLKEVARNIAKSQLNMMGRGWSGEANPDPRGLFQTAMLKAVKAQLTPEQVGRYQKEVDQRIADRKRTSIRNIVAQMDMDLVLTAEQREKLAATLTTNWNDKWSTSMESFLYGAAYLPNIPEKLTDVCLNESQKKVWKSTPRGQNIFFGGLGMLNNMAVEVEGVVIDALDEAKAVDEKVEDKSEEKKKP